MRASFSSAPRYRRRAEVALLEDHDALIVLCRRGFRTPPPSGPRSPARGNLRMETFGRPGDKVGRPRNNVESRLQPSSFQGLNAAYRWSTARSISSPPSCTLQAVLHSGSSGSLLSFVETDGPFLGLHSLSASPESKALAKVSAIAPTFPPDFSSARLCHFDRELDQFRIRLLTPVSMNDGPGDHIEAAGFPRSVSSRASWPAPGLCLLIELDQSGN